MTSMHREKANMIVNLQYSKTEYNKVVNKNSKKKDKLFSFIDYLVYNDRQEACDKTTEIIDKGIFDYYNYRVGSTGQFTAKGESSAEKTLINYDKFKPEIVYRGVISFDNLFTIENGIKNPIAMKKVIGKSIEPSLRKAGFDISNVEYGCFYHTNTSHPHVHYYFFEKSKTRKLDRLSRNQMRAIKSSIMNNIIDNTSIYIDRDKIKNDLLNSIKGELSDEQLFDFNNSLNNKYQGDKNLAKLIKDLDNILPKDKSFKFNSKNIRPFHNDINSVVDYILNKKEVSSYFDLYNKHLEKENKIYKANYGNTKDETKNNEFVVNKQKELHDRIANMLLQSIKQSREERSIGGFSLNNNMKVLKDYKKEKPTYISESKSIQKALTKNSSKINEQNNLLTRSSNLQHGAIQELSQLIAESIYIQHMRENELNHMVAYAKSEIYR